MKRWRNPSFQNGAAFKLTRDMFSFSNVEENDIPKLEFLLSSEDNAERDYLIRGAAIQLNGVNLFRDGDAASKSEWFEIDSETGVADDTPVDPPVVTSYLVDEMEGEPIDMNTSSVSIFGTNLATAQKVQFFYQDGAQPAATPFFEKDVTPSSDTSIVTGALGCTAATTDSTGYFRVVNASGASEHVACSFAM